MRSNGAASLTERARREQILRAAIALLADGGYGAASLSAIAARIGASKGTISYHFDGKEELLSQVVTSVVDQAGAFMAQRVDAADSVPAKLRVYIEANLEFLASYPAEVRALNAVLVGLPPRPDGLPTYTAAGHEAVTVLAALLRRGQATGDFRPFDPLVVAQSLRASIDAVTELLRVEPSLDVSAYAADLRALFEPGILA